MTGATRGPVALACGLALACGPAGERPADERSADDPRDDTSAAGGTALAPPVVADTQLVVDSIGREFLIITTGRPRIREVRPRAGSGDPDAPGTLESIDPRTAEERMRRAPVPWYVLDVRSAQEYVAEGHLPGAALVPLERLEENVDDLHVRTDQVVMVYADGTRKAREAARLLASYGFPVVRVLDGGLPAWREAGLPIEGGR